MREAAANLLVELLEQGKTANFFDLALLIKIVAEFREPIRSAIPHIIALFTDKDEHVRRVATKLLGKLLEQGKVADCFLIQCY